MFRKITKILYRTLDNREISYKELKKMISTDENVILLDVRSVQEFSEGHLENAINIPLYSIDDCIKEIPDKNCPIIIYCASRV